MAEWTFYCSLHAIAPADVSRDCWSVIVVIPKWLLTKLHKIAHHADILFVKLLWHKKTQNKYSIVHVYQVKMSEIFNI